jgi:hypothetical protein
VSVDGRGSSQSDSAGFESRHCASKDTLSEPDLIHVCKCVLGRQQDLKFYFLHMKSNEVGTTLKLPETINGNVKNLSKRMKMKDKGECHFYLLGWVKWRGWGPL